MDEEREAGEVECCTTSADGTAFIVSDPNSTAGDDCDDADSAPTNSTSYYFDKVIPSSSTQKDVYDTVGAPMVANALDPTNPKNSVLFSFGVSNSGKTWTLLGGSDEDSQGVLPRIISNLFASPDSTLDISMLEIYNESIYDLLLPPTPPPSSSSSSSSTPSKTPSKRKSSTSKPLKIHQDSGTFYVSSLSTLTCTSSSSALQTVTTGLKSTTTSATGMNSQSSRGHTVIILTPSSTSSQIMLVDMAGLERTKKSAVYGSSMRESTSINSSIMRVTSCLKILKYNSLHKSKKLVPYRESKLTMLLQPIFSGASSTQTNVTMLVSAYTGQKDTLEKSSLLKEVEGLRGLKISLEKGKIKKSRYSFAKGPPQKDDDGGATKEKIAGTNTPKKRSPRPGLNSPVRGASTLAAARKKKLESENALLNRKVEVMAQEVEAQKATIKELEEEREKGSLEDVVIELEGELERAREEVDRLNREAEEKEAEESTDNDEGEEGRSDELRIQVDRLERENVNLRADLSKLRATLSEKSSLDDSLSSLRKEVLYLRSENKRLAISAGSSVGKILSPSSRAREIEEHHKRQALISDPLAEHIKSVSALSGMQGRGPFKAPSFSLNVPKRWNEGGNGGIKRCRGGGEEEEKEEGNKRGKLETVHEKENKGHSRDETESDADWISLLESSSVQLN
ncbi:hypothetical protein TrST_g9944 [Triparma strigata]|nr:hypothetical protein TrST_g9944 [Triparma strigata]